MTPLAELLNDMDADMRRRRNRGLLAALLIGLAVLAGAWVDGANAKDFARERACADRVGVYWSRSTGVTEHLAAFRACMVLR